MKFAQNAIRIINQHAKFEDCSSKIVENPLSCLSIQRTEAIKPTVPNIQYCFARRNSHFICLYVIHYCNTFLINKKVYFRITEHNYHPKKHKLHNNKLLFL